MKSIRDVAKVRKKVRLESQWSDLVAFAFQQLARSVVSAPPRGLITFDGALEQLWEDAIRDKLMEDTAQELLDTPAAFPGDHHAGVERGEKRTRNLGQ